MDRCSNLKNRKYTLLNLSKPDKANLERVAARVDYEGESEAVSYWFRYGIEKGDPIPDDVAAVESGLQFLRTHLSTDGPYAESAPELAARITGLINEDKEAGDMLAVVPQQATLPTPNVPVTGVPFEFVGLSNGDTIQSFDQILAWKSLDGDTTRQWDLLIREAQYGPFDITQIDEANVLYNSSGLGVLTNTQTQPVSWPTNGGQLYVRLSASGPNGWSGWDPIIEGYYIDITINSWTQPPAPVVPFNFVGLADGDLITSQNQLLYWESTDGNTLVQYDVLARLASYGPFSTTQHDVDNVFYDTQGIGTLTDSSTQPITWPTNGELVNLRILRSNPADGSWAGWNAIAEGSYFDITVTAPTVTPETADDISMAGLSLLQMPSSVIPEGSWTSATWADTLPPNSSLIFSSLEANISSKIINGDMYINARMDPLTGANDTAGTNRPEVGIDIDDDTHYRMVFETLIPASFDYGINLNQRTAKLGPGFASDKVISGGSPDDDGFSARLNMRADNTLLASEAWWCIYSYAANRNNQFGDDLFLLNEDGSRHIIQKDALYRFGVEIKMNSTAAAADGYIRVWVQVDGAPKWLALQQTGIQWWGSAIPIVERIFWQMFHGGNSISWRPANSNDICFRALGWAKGGFTTTVQPPAASSTMTYAQIRAAGDQNKGYEAAFWHDDHLAEFLNLNDTVTSWTVDEANEIIYGEEEPAPAANAISLPAPTGGNDTNRLYSAMQANKSYVGSGTYKIAGLNFDKNNVKIHNLNLEPASGATTMVTVTADDVYLDKLTIDAKRQSSVYRGLVVEKSAARFKATSPTICNFHHKAGGVGTGNLNVAGIFLRGTDGYHIARPHIEHLINDTGVTGNLGYRQSSVVATCNGIVITGSNQHVIGDGYIAGGYINNIQSNGSGRDAEGIKIQGHANNGVFDKYPRIFSMEAYDTGKRFIKQQSSGLLAVGCYYHTTTLTSRDLTEIRFPFNHYNCVLAAGVRGNVVRNCISEDTTGRYESIFDWTSNGAMRDSAFEYNQVILNTPNTRTSQIIPVFLIQGTLTATPAPMPINSRINNNRVTGPARYIYKYKSPIPNPAPSSLTLGNTWAQNPTVSIYG